LAALLLLSGRGDVDALLARLEANRDRVCERPVLRGEPLEGPADDDLLAILEGRGALGPCRSFLLDHGDDLLGPPSSGGGGDTAPMGAFREACAALLPAVRQATQHRDACSPFLPGRRGLPDLRASLRILSAARHLAALEVLAGRTAEASERFLDLARLCQDLGRGGPPVVLLIMVSGVQRQILENDLAQILDRGDLEAGDLERLEGALAQLRRSEPSLGEAVAGDGQWLAAEAGLPLLMGPGWVPPGGFSFGHAGIPTDPPDLVPLVPAKREPGLLLQAFLDLDRQRREACPAEALPSDCHRGLSELSERFRERQARPGWIRILAALGNRDPMNRGLGGYLAEVVQDRIAQPFEGYAARVVFHGFLLAATRLRAAVLLHRLRNGRCPALAELGSPAWADRLLDPAFGMPMDVSAVAGGFTVSPGGTLPGPAPPASLRIPCGPEPP
ncbi:MAG: hypothetical protein FJ098_03990, partial [Deltaproteobacteria bacterium]|nr:hypothetical protein [Deltaproteobacteria bacterium]